ncbi:MAG: hypothetical protein Q4E13_02015 [Clostridia bacterium]|nr:hypothetical protein [Clostridia bacterium]
MLIPFRYKYKEYANAPRATQHSRTLAIVTAWPMLAVYGFFWMAIVNYVLLTWIANSDVCIIVALLSLIPFFFALHKLKARRVRKIDQMALAERLAAGASGK